MLNEKSLIGAIRRSDQLDTLMALFGENLPQFQSNLGLCAEICFRIKNIIEKNAGNAFAGKKINLVPLRDCINEILKDPKKYQDDDLVNIKQILTSMYHDTVRVDLGIELIQRIEKHLTTRLKPYLLRSKDRGDIVVACAKTGTMKQFNQLIEAIAEDIEKTPNYKDKAEITKLLYAIAMHDACHDIRVSDEVLDGLVKKAILLWQDRRKPEKIMGDQLLVRQFQGSRQTDEEIQMSRLKASLYYLGKYNKEALGAQYEKFEAFVEFFDPGKPSPPQEALYDWIKTTYSFTDSDIKMEKIIECGLPVDIIIDSQQKVIEYDGITHFTRDLFLRPTRDRTVKDFFHSENIKKTGRELHHVTSYQFTVSQEGAFNFEWRAKKQLNQFINPEPIRKIEPEGKRKEPVSAAIQTEKEERAKRDTSKQESSASSSTGKRKEPVSATTQTEKEERAKRYTSKQKSSVSSSSSSMFAASSTPQQPTQPQLQPSSVTYSNPPVICVNYPPIPPMFTIEIENPGGLKTLQQVPTTMVYPEYPQPYPLTYMPMPIPMPMPTSFPPYPMAAAPVAYPQQPYHGIAPPWHVNPTQPEYPPSYNPEEPQPSASFGLR